MFYIFSFSQMKKKIQDVLKNIFGDEFNLFDMCAKSKDIWYGPYKVVIYKMDVYFAIGPVPMYFSKYFVFCFAFAYPLN